MIAQVKQRAEKQNVFKVNKSNWAGWLVSAIIILPVIYAGIVMIPRSTKLTSLADLPSQLDSITVPPQTVLLDAGAVKMQLPFIDYSYGSSWAVVSMPRKSLANFIAQASFFMPTNSADTEVCRDWVLKAPQRQHFRSDEWKADAVKHYKVWWFAGKSISVMVDLDSPSTARVYMNLN